MLLVDPYPIAGRSYTPMELAMAKLQNRVLPPPPVAINAMELARKLTDEPANNDLPMSLHDALRMSGPYKDWKAAMPPLYQVPALHRYRNEYPHYDASAVALDIQTHGRPIPMGQLLFHGGVWPPFLGPVQVDQSFTTNEVFSASLCPQVAAIHGTYHPDGALWAIKVGRTGGSKPAFVFNSDRRQRLGHEYEVVFGPGITLTCTAVSDGQRLRLIEVELT